jgi:hypothetical protein
MEGDDVVKISRMIKYILQGISMREQVEYSTQLNACV